MNLKELVDQVESVALSVANVKSFMDIDIMALDGEKYVSDPVVLFSLTSINKGIGKLIELDCELYAFTLIDATRSTYRYAMSITIQVMTDLLIALENDNLIASAVDTPYELVKASNGFEGLKANVKIYIDGGC